MTSEARPPSLTREEEQKELASVLAVPAFARSTNLVRLLTFICEKYFEGKTEEIRETTIAIHALGRRAEDFDSQVDPIVRVTARTLRKRLEEYYRHEGRTHAVQLDLPTGQYVPQFIQRETLPPESPGPTVPFTGAVAAPPATGASPGWLRWRLGVLLVAGLLACLASFWLGRRMGATRATASSACPPCPCGIWDAPVWSDEFDSPAGTAPDPAKWTYDIGNSNGWGNGELEVYCAPGASHPPPCDSQHPNSFQDGQGNLVIAATRTASGTWTSARIKTQGLAVFRYGRIEARLRLPQGAGLWSSFWMLGANIQEVSWPDSGSISLMENVSMRPTTNGLGPHMVRSTIHGPGYFGGNGIWQNYTLPDGGRVDDGGYHVYGAIWSPQMIQFYVDDPENVFFVRTASELPTGGRWAFDHPFFIVMSLAIGGQWPGPPDGTTPNPSLMLIDYVRVYRAATVVGPKMSASTIAVKAGATGSSTVRLTSTSGTPRVALACSGVPPNATCTLNPPVADFSNTATQTITLTVGTTSSAGPARALTPAGRYRIKMTAITVSGDASTADVPLTVTAD